MPKNPFVLMLLWTGIFIACGFALAAVLGPNPDPWLVAGIGGIVGVTAAAVFAWQSKRRPSDDDTPAP